jgi:DNA-binding MarR family transcriptional regulator
VLEAIQRSPGIHQGRLAADLGLTGPGVAWHLDRLDQAGLILRRRMGRRVNLFSSSASEVAAAS